MKRVALALTWDGARWPTRSLPAKARAFLGTTAPTAPKLAQLIQDDQVSELRICWVPRLKGGNDVLSTPFPTAKRIALQPTKTVPMGDILGVVYQRYNISQKP